MPLTIPCQQEGLQERTRRMGLPPATRHRGVLTLLVATMLYDMREEQSSALQDLLLASKRAISTMKVQTITTQEMTSGHKGRRHILGHMASDMASETHV